MSSAFTSLPRTLRAYILSVVCLAAVAAAWLVPTRLPAGQHLWILIALLTGTGIVSVTRLKLPLQSQWISFDLVFISLTQVFLGTPYSTLGAALGALLGSQFSQSGTGGFPRYRPLHFYQVCFNIAVCTLAATVAGASYAAVSHLAGALDEAAIVPGLGVWATAYFLVNTAGVVGAISLDKRVPFWSFWREHWSWTAPGYFAAAAATGLVYALWSRFSLFSLLPLPLVYFVHAAFREHAARTQLQEKHIEELSRLVESLMASLAMAIEAKDSYTREHIQRVQFFATRLAEKAKLSDQEREAVRLAALVHDIGKIAIPERILNKPGKLTPEEFTRMKTHVDVGVMILEPVGFTIPVVDAVRSHHERWDGLGYPNGLKGDAIPVCGRVIAVADLFDALTSDRPYRKAMPWQEALEIIRQSAGTQLDPYLVDAFAEISPELVKELESRKAAAAQEAAGHGTALPDRIFSELAAAASEDVVAAFETIETLLADPEDDLWRLALEHVRRIVPCVTAVVYEVRPEGEDLIAATVEGEFKDLLRGMTIRMGEGVAGRSARDQRPFLNASAMPDVGRVFDPTAHVELSAALCVPVVVRNDTVAVIALYHSSYEIFRDRHLHVLTTVAGHLSTALELRRQSAEERVMAVTDAATGLYNIRYLMRFMDERLPLLRREKRSLSLILLDLDRFKRINDVYGHVSGDEAIAAVARRLRDTARREDIVCRYGGDEFVIVLQDTGREEAERLAERIRQTVADLVLWDDVHLTCSAGVSVFPEDGPGLKALVAAADLRMYRDKVRGRVMAQEETIPDESIPPPFPYLLPRYPGQE